MKLRSHYDIRFREVGPALTEGDLDRCEEQLRVRLPWDYRRLLLQTNGGKPTPNGLIHICVSLPTERLFSIHSPTADDDLVAVCLELRTNRGLPHRFLPVARIQGGDSYLLVDCDPEMTGRLYHWRMAEAGFRLNDPEFDNVALLSYSVRDIPAKFGPLRNREDMDGMFAQLYAKAGGSQGAKAAEQVVAAGYDINFVLPGCQHPVFGAIDATAFGVAQKMIELGTRADHADRDKITVSERLWASLQWWQNRLAESDLSDNIHQMARRHIAAIEASLAVYAQTPGKSS